MIEPKYRTFWPRLGAGLLDGLIFLPITFLDKLVFSLGLPEIILVIWYLFTSTVYYFYSVLMHGTYGQTLGKMVCRVRVLDISEKALSTRQAFMRDSVVIVFGLISTIALFPGVLAGMNPYEPEDITGIQVVLILFWVLSFQFWFFLEFVTMLFSRKRRAIHDFIARSVVVKVA